jgi:hypothetical protein
MSRNQRRIFAGFVCALLLSQCLSLALSFPGTPAGLRAWMSESATPGAPINLRLGVFTSKRVEAITPVRYRVRLLSAAGHDQLLREWRSEHETNDLQFTPPAHWPTGRARLVIDATWDGDEQNLEIPLLLGPPTASGVLFEPAWRARAGEDAMDPAIAPPKIRVDRPILRPYPEGGWAVRNLPQDLLVRVIPLAGARGPFQLRNPARPKETDTTDAAGFARLEFAQPMRRGRFDVELRNATSGSWRKIPLWLHNPPAELRITAQRSRVRPLSEVRFSLLSERPSATYTLFEFHGERWVGSHDVTLTKGRAELVLTAPEHDGWLSLTWVRNLNAKSRRRARATVRVGDAPLPTDLPSSLRFPQTGRAAEARDRRLLPSLFAPPLAADTLNQRKQLSEHEVAARMRVGVKIFQVLISLFFIWLIASMALGYRETLRRRRVLAEETDGKLRSQGSPLIFFGALGMLAALLLLLLSISYLFDHLVWGF